MRPRLFGGLFLLIFILGIFALQMAFPSAAMAEGGITDTPAEAVAATPSSSAISGSSTYALINVPEKGVLSVRMGPGGWYKRLGGLEATTIGVPLTGNVSGKFPNIWLEVQHNPVQKGWISSYYVIEYVKPDDFCKDDRVKTVITDFAASVSATDGQKAANLVSPLHGVTVRVWRTGAALNYLKYAQYLFTGTYKVNWGFKPGTLKAEYGGLKDSVYPRLKDVFTAKYELYCNDFSKISLIPKPWPAEYKNVNFYLVYKPESGTGKNDWHAWIVGIDYLDHKPYLFSLTNIEPE